MGGMHGAKACETSRHGHAARPGDIHSGSEQACGGRTRRRPSGVDHHTFAIDQNIVEPITAQSGHHRFNHGISEANRHRRINGIAAGPQNIQPRLGGQRMISPNSPISTHNQRPMRTWNQVHGKLQRMEVFCFFSSKKKRCS